jgi:hypothetical protein
MPDDIGRRGATTKVIVRLIGLSQGMILAIEVTAG